VWFCLCSVHDAWQLFASYHSLASLSSWVSLIAGCLFALFAADCSTRLSTPQGLSRMRLFCSSLGRYGDGGFLCLTYGCSELPQAFTRYAPASPTSRNLVLWLTSFLVFLLAASAPARCTMARLSCEQWSPERSCSPMLSARNIEVLVAIHHFDCSQPLLCCVCAAGIITNHNQFLSSGALCADPEYFPNLRSSVVT
jgi:hypothetical protein